MADLDRTGDIETKVVGLDGITSADVTTNNLLKISPNWNTARHFNGTASATSASIDFSGTSQTIAIQNTGNRSLQVSFDSATSWFTVYRRGALTLDASHQGISIKTNTSTSTYEMLVVI